MAQKKSKKWIQGAIKHPGRLRRLAAKEGALTSSGKIKTAWLRRKAKSDDRSLASAARLALRLQQMPKRGRRKKK